MGKILNLLMHLQLCTFFYKFSKTCSDFQRHVDLRANTSKQFLYFFIKKMASKKCLIAWAIFLVFVLFLTSQATATAPRCRRSGKKWREIHLHGRRKQGEVYSR
ncbi:hypothetical protein ACOSP7_025821 [Xanthoceras sorbifolium]